MEAQVSACLSASVAFQLDASSFSSQGSSRLLATFFFFPFRLSTSSTDSRTKKGPSRLRDASRTQTRRRPSAPTSKQKKENERTRERPKNPKDGKRNESWKLSKLESILREPQIKHHSTTQPLRRTSSYQTSSHQRFPSRRSQRFPSSAAYPPEVEPTLSS